MNEISLHNIRHNLRDFRCNRTSYPLIAYHSVLTTCRGIIHKKFRKALPMANQPTDVRPLHQNIYGNKSHTTTRQNCFHDNDVVRYGILHNHRATIMVKNHDSHNSNRRDSLYSLIQDTKKQQKSERIAYCEIECKTVLKLKIIISRPASIIRQMQSYPQITPHNYHTHIETQSQPRT